MADFARVLAAVAVVLGTFGLDDYLRKQRALATDSVMSDVFMQKVIETMSTGFEGTAANGGRAQ